MNILVIGKFSEGQFGFHISETLKEMGHTTITFVPLLESKSSKTKFGRRINQINHVIYNNLINTQIFRERRKNKLSKLIKKTKIDLTISTHDFLYPDEVDFIKTKTKAPVVMWFPDGIGYALKSFFIVSTYENLFFQDPYAVNVLRNQYNMKNVYYLPECCNPNYHKNIILTQQDFDKYNCDISTYGSPHNYRSFLFNQLRTLNLSIKIWGHLPPIWQTNEEIKSLYTGKYLVNEEKAKSVLAAKINLNTLVPVGIYGLNARAFEIAGIGGFQMIHWRAGLAELFEDGKEIVSFNTFDELIEKIKHYINKPEERNAIAKAGQIKAYNNHTYELRLKLLINTIFNNAKGYETSLIKKTIFNKNEHL